MKLFVTGAAGFLGSAVVERACLRGHDVIALVRSTAAADAVTAACPRADVVVGDLRRPDTYRAALAEAHAVIHLAATKAGGFYQQFAGTVVATESLLDAMKATGADRLIHVSTFSVYDYDAVRRGGVLDESTPVEHDPSTRDAYAQTKILQERLVLDASTAGLKTTVIRPGAVWGGDDLWDGATGQVVGPLWVAIGDGVTAKFTYVENCAEAIVLAAERPESIGEAINVVDDELPSQRSYASELRRRGIAVPRAVPVPFAAIHAVTRAIAALNGRALGGRARLPSMLVTRSLDARFKPVRCPNEKAKRLLGWTPRFGLAEGLDRAATRRRG